MKVALAGYGSRGDVEPLAATGRELLRRGHDVSMAVPPNMIGFVESAALAAVSYGPDSREDLNPATDLLRNMVAKAQNPISALPEIIEHGEQFRYPARGHETPLEIRIDREFSGIARNGGGRVVAGVQAHADEAREADSRHGGHGLQ